MKHIIKVNNIQDVKNNRIRPLIAMDSNGVLFAEGKAPVPEGFVDLGLPSGTFWSTKNIGATNGNTKESWYGNYYAWGEIETKVEYNQSTYKYANGAWNKLTKYCNNSSYGNDGYTDQLTKLVPEDDITTVSNSAWRMPTKEDFEELIAGTTSSWVTDYNGISGLNGRIFTKATITRPAFKKNIPLYSQLFEGVITDKLWAEITIYTLEEINVIIGVEDIRKEIFKDEQMTVKAEYNKDYRFVEKEADPSVSMFIPAAGFRFGSNINYVGSGCYLWSSSLYLDSPSYAYRLLCNSRSINMSNYDRFDGFSLRPIC